MATTRLRLRPIVLAAVGVLLCASGAALAQAPAGPTTAAQEAGKLYTSAMSQYSAGQYKQAQPLLEKFIAAYATHEYVPVAYLQLAACRSNQKDTDGYLKALDETIARFYGSPAWFIAYGSKARPRQGQKDNDGYLTLLEAMVRQCEEVPFRLHGDIGWYWGDYYDNELNNWQALDPTAVKLGNVVSPARLGAGHTGNGRHARAGRAHAEAAGHDLQAARRGPAARLAVRPRRPAPPGRQDG